MNPAKAVREHPFITAIFVVCTGAGAAITLAFGLEGFSTLRSLVAGGVAGAGVACIVVASRALGAFAEDDADGSGETPTDGG